MSNPRSLILAHLGQDRLILASLFLLALAITSLIAWRPIDLVLPTAIQDGLTIFLGIIVEALPYIVIGALVSALIRRFISPDRLLKLVPAHPALALPAACLLGMLFPVCECGNLPVARSLVRQGLKPAYAITFLLAAPILNPAVIITTWAAFQSNLDLVASRFIVGAIVAITVGYFFYRNGDKGLLLNAEEQQYLHPQACSMTAHATFIGEFVEMLSALAFGAAIAAILQVAVPYQIITSVANQPALAIIAMIVLALVISICSTVDAFFALAYAAVFPPAALLAFLVFGPMIDIKAISLMSRAWKPKTIAIISLLVTQLVFVICLALHYTNLL